MELIELVEQAQQGDLLAFGTICRRFEGLVKKYAYQGHLCQLREEAEAEGWLAVADAVKKYDKLAGVQFAGYVESRVRYGLWNLFKRERRRWEHEVLIEGSDHEEQEVGGGFINRIPDGINLAAEVENMLLGQCINEYIQTLPVRQRQVVVLTIVGERRLTELADCWGITVQAVYNLRQRGLKRLKTLCAGMYVSERG